MKNRKRKNDARDRLSCLVLSSAILDPRVGRFMDKSTPLSSVSRLFQQVFKRHSGPFFHVVHPSHPWFPLFSCSRRSALHDCSSSTPPVSSFRLLFSGTSTWWQLNWDNKIIYSKMVLMYMAITRSGDLNNFGWYHFKGV